MAQPSESERRGAQQPAEPQRKARPAPKESLELEQDPYYTPQERTEEAQEGGEGRRMVRGKESQ